MTLTIAVPKGRVVRDLVPLLARAGIGASALLAEDRRLVRESDDGSLRFLLLKPDDVPTYVEYGAAALGVSGRDILDERGYELYQPLDLGIGKCRMVVAAPRGAAVPAVPRIATKYPRIATAHFTARGVLPDVIYVQGSVEIAPQAGLADAIVNLVQSGATLAENDLVEVETILHVSSILVANRSLFKLCHEEIAALLARLRTAVGAG